jgi:hypothetical protein
MNDNLRQLEVKKLLKELEFVEADFEYKSNFIDSIDKDFMVEIDNLLDKNPKLREVFDEKIKPVNILEKSEEEIIPVIEESNELMVVDNKTIQMKKLYRDIAKISHPDKNKKLDSIYIKSTNHYNNNDIIGIYLICNDLGIPYDIDDSVSEEIALRIDKIKNRIKFIESTLTWKWFYSEKESDKNKILLKYIEGQLLR